MSHYLFSHSRSDLTFAVSKAERFVYGTLRVHEVTL